MRDAITPIRQQYLKIKKQYPQAIVLFRLGDFYETFDEDAKITSRELEIVLTSREMGKGNKVPMAGIPYHAIDNYLAKLINRGYKVAICEQMTKPGATKGIVQREVIRVVTPGTVIEPGLLESKQNNYLVSLSVDGETAGIAYVDITTSEFAATQLPLARVRAELARLQPSEIIVPKDAPLADLAITAPLTKLDDYEFEYEVAKQSLLRHFEAATLEGFGIAGLPQAVKAAGAIVQYLSDTQKSALSQLAQLTIYSTEKFMALDAVTQTNLEIFRTAAGQVKGSLLGVIDATKTAMGGRLLKRWLSQPLLDITELKQRQDAIEYFVKNPLIREEVIMQWRQTADLERLVNRIAGGSALPLEVVALSRTLEKIPALTELLKDVPFEPLKSALQPQPDVVALIDVALNPEPGSAVGEGNVIKAGFSAELDSVREISANTRQYLAGLERAEQEKTGIKSLKIGYNQVFGYYLEVSKSNLAQVPANYIRKQTLSTGERYYTPELKEYEAAILNARERIDTLERALYQQVCQQVAGSREPILKLAAALAHLDVFTALAETAAHNVYTRPVLNEEDAINITGGRHPVVERSLTDTSFVPNDTHLSNGDDQIIVLTGPNMAGKSTYLKQVALIVLLAQIGSFVPAEKPRLALSTGFSRVSAPGRI